MTTAGKTQDICSATVDDANLTIGDAFSGLSIRLQEITAGMSCPQIASIGNVSSETARRYLRDGRPSVQFVAELAKHCCVSLDWLLLERGTRFHADVDQKRLSMLNGIEILKRELARIQEVKVSVRKTDAMLDKIIHELISIELK